MVANPTGIPVVQPLRAKSRKSGPHNRTCGVEEGGTPPGLCVAEDGFAPMLFVGPHSFRRAIPNSSCAGVHQEAR